MKKQTSDITEADIQKAIKYLETNKGKGGATRENAIKLLQGMQITAHMIAHDKVENEVTGKCPVCGNTLNGQPWNGNSASLEICSVCGIQFGYDDAAGGKKEMREDIYKRWRESWFKNDHKPLSSGQIFDLHRS